jgi:hypothetical protein
MISGLRVGGIRFRTGGGYFGPVEFDSERSSGWDAAREADSSLSTPELCPKE